MNGRKEVREKEKKTRWGKRKEITCKKGGREEKKEIKKGRYKINSTVKENITFVKEWNKHKKLYTHRKWNKTEVK